VRSRSLAPSLALLLSLASVATDASAGRSGRAAPRAKRAATAASKVGGRRTPAITPKRRAPRTSAALRRASATIRRLARDPRRDVPRLRDALLLAILDGSMTLADAEAILAAAEPRAFGAGAMFDPIAAGVFVDALGAPAGLGADPALVAGLQAELVGATFEALVTAIDAVVDGARPGTAARSRIVTWSGFYAALEDLARRRLPPSARLAAARRRLAVTIRRVERLRVLDLIEGLVADATTRFDLARVRGAIDDAVRRQLLGVIEAGRLIAAAEDAVVANRARDRGLNP
jgi:hypothetical protein